MINPTKFSLKKMTSIKECYDTIMDLHKKYYKENQRNLGAELYISCFGFPQPKEKNPLIKTKREEIKTKREEITAVSSNMKVELVAYYQNDKELDWLIDNV